MLVALDGKNGATPLRGKGGGNILRGGDTQTNEPLAETVRTAIALGLESGFKLRIGDHAAAEKKQTQGHAMKMRQRLVGQAKETVEDAGNGVLEAVEAAVPAALKQYAFVIAPPKDPSQRIAKGTLGILALHLFLLGLSVLLARPLRGALFAKPAPTTSAKISGAARAGRYR
jgi:hypothetical protein